MIWSPMRNCAVQEDGDRAEQLFQRILSGQRDGQAGNAQAGQPGADVLFKHRLSHAERRHGNQQQTERTGHQQHDLTA